ncbi:MAG: D-Ala-D-Ala carboxypeptidase family metallohydrolase [Gammaproteobacteria bacterium]|nr:D-Ala-D-Ala carboxypeptidase family metallohydrolase [Gammaproteobacteria bacterium]
MSRIQLTNNFYLDEFTRSDVAARHGIVIDVQINDAVYLNLLRLCINVLQPLREALGPVHILSGVRPVQLNTLIGGSKTSQHISGCAADIVVTGHTPLEVARWIYYSCLYDQVIHEFGQWTHVSTSAAVVFDRAQPLTAIKQPRLLRKPKTVYVPGLLSMEDALRMIA